MRHAVILAGGGGTRLWPASRRARPKQLMVAPGGETLVGMTARRLAGLGELGLVTAAEQLAAVAAALTAEGHAIAEVALVAEPVARSTAAAIGLAAVHALTRDPDAVLGVFPADHHVGDVAAFRAAAARAYELSEREAAIVTIGIAPERPDPGFGYLALGPARADGVCPVARFVEKPDPARAAALIAGGALWNGGMFFARARRIVDEIARHLPATGAVLGRIGEALGRGRAAGDALAAELYPTVPAISFDHGVMEKTAPVLAVRGELGWSDIGSWPALAGWRAADPAGNVAHGDALAIDARGNLVVTDQGVVVLIGVDDLVVVRSGDAILVVPKARAHEVKDAVSGLAAAGMERYV